MSVERAFRDLPDSFDPPAQAAPSEPKSCRDFAGTLAIVTFTWLFGTLVLLWRVVPKFAEVFAEVKAVTPAWTEAVIGCSRAAIQWPIAFALLAVVASVSAGLLKGPARKGAIALLPVLIVLTIGGIVGGLFLPLLGSLEGVGQGRR